MKYIVCLFRKTKDEYLKEVMRDNTQLLINKVWEVHVQINSYPKKIVKIIPLYSYSYPLRSQMALYLQRLAYHI